MANEFVGENELGFAIAHGGKEIRLGDGNTRRIEDGDRDSRVSATQLVVPVEVSKAFPGGRTADVGQMIEVCPEGVVRDELMDFHLIDQVGLDSEDIGYLVEAIRYLQEFVIG